MTIELIVFDMAGTTVHDDDNVNICLRDALKAAGYYVTRDEVNEVMGYPKPVAIKTLIANHEDLPEKADDELVERVYQDFLHRMLEHYKKHPSVREITGASETFRRLKSKGVKIVLDTGFSREIAQAIIDRLGWEKNRLIDGSITSDEVKHGRPHPDMLFKAMLLTDVTDAKKVAKVGDTPSDLQEGAAAGCAMVIGVTNGAYTKEELLPYPHTHLIESIVELPELLFSDVAVK